MYFAKLVLTILAPGSTLLWAVDDTLCRKRGLTVYGTGMHYDPLISSRAKPFVSWGHDWIVLCLLVVHPFWAASKVFALPVAMRLYRNRQGLTKGKGRNKGSGVDNTIVNRVVFDSRPHIPPCACAKARATAKHFSSTSALWG